jgi:hypothetical protein
MITIDSQGPKLAESEICDFERDLGMALPEQYRQFLREFNGGTPTPDIVDIEGLPGTSTDVQVFFGIRRSVESSCLDWNLATLAERLDPGLLPIASDSGESVFGLCLRVSDYGAADSYARRGLVAESRFLAGGGAIYRRSTYQYQLRDPATGAALTDAQAQSQGSVFAALVREDHYQHEGDPAAAVHTYTRQDYDTDGNVTEVFDAGGPGASDDVRTEIRYSGRLSTCRARHIVGVPDRIVVRDGAGTRLRERHADIQCADPR